MGYYSLDEVKVVAYLKDTGLFSKSARLKVREIGDGNINIIYHVTDEKTAKSMILKQAYPYVRCVGESWPLTLDRIRIEADAMEIQDKYAPGLVPKVYHRNDQMAVVAMEDLSGLGVMRTGTIAMKKYPNFAEHISTFLANLLFYTSDLAMEPEDKKELVGKFLNPHMRRICEDLIFTEPYYDAKRNIINLLLKDYLEKIFWKKDSLRLEASKFKYKYLTEAQSLLHGDLHTGSIFADEHQTKVFDSEFSFVGPSAFDMGSLIGNLLINYLSWSGKDVPVEKIRDYREHLLDTIAEIYQLFRKKFLENWDNDCSDIITRVAGYKEFYMRNLFVDMVAYAAIVMIRRMHGLAHNIDVDGIKDLEKRKEVQILILELAEELIMNRKKFADIKEVTKFVRQQVY